VGGMKELDGGERYIVTLEVLGPKGANIAAQVDELVGKFKAAPINAVVKVSINGQKPGQNQ
jgi:hypothetical protein